MQVLTTSFMSGFPLELRWIKRHSCRSFMDYLRPGTKLCLFTQNSYFFLFLHDNIYSNIYHTLCRFQPGRRKQLYPWVNSVDPDKMAHNEPFHQDLNSLPFCYCFFTETSICNMDVFKFNKESISKNQGW